jgi:flagellar motor switch protein FliN
MAAGATAGVREVRGPEGLAGSADARALLRFRLQRGTSGAGALLLPGAVALGLTRLLLGLETEGLPAAPGADELDALGELANQVASSVATALGEILGKPVGFEAPEVEWLAAGPGGPPAGLADCLVLVLDLAAGPVRGEGLLAVPRAGLLPAPPPQAAEVALPPLSEAPARKGGGGMELLLDIALPVTVELGRTRMVIRDILHLAPGSVLELDKLAGEPVDILVNDKSIARGEVVVIDENFGVRLTSIVTPSERVVSLR